MGRFVVITGASSGIGRAFAYEFANRGHNLILVARNIQRLNIIKDDLASTQVNIHNYHVDLSDEQQLDRFVETLKDSQYSIKILINSAGFGLHGSFLDQEIESHRNMLKLNCEALITLTYEIGNIMKIKDMVKY